MQARSSVNCRKSKLRLLRKALMDYRQDLRDALIADFAKSEQETDLSEILTVKSEINNVLSNLSEWAAPKRVSGSLLLAGTRSEILTQPKGVVLIISPWNFPVLLCLGPLVSAYAAGNCCVLKPSEFTPHTNRVIRKLLQGVFSEREVAFVEGGPELTGKLIALPFDHIFFTGSPRVGRIVMEAAAKNLTPVTLELGGKSPAIVDESANVRDAAMRIAWGKWLNAGQTCIAPDYILADRRIKDELLKQLAYWTERFYGTQPETNADFSGIINQPNLERLSKLGEGQSAGTKLPPVIMEVLSNHPSMQEEIFGPVLPVLSFDSVSEAIEIVNKGHRPLALYIFSGSKTFQKKVLDETRSGGVAINETLLHFFHPELPFGGIGNSGMGKGRGHAGFMEFSHRRSVLHQRFRWNALWFILPPFTPLKKRIIDLILRWF